MNANVRAFDQFIVGMLNLNLRSMDSNREREEDKRRIASSAPEGPATLIPQDRH